LIVPIAIDPRHSRRSLFRGSGFFFSELPLLRGDRFSFVESLFFWLFAFARTFLLDFFNFYARI